MKIFLKKQGRIIVVMNGRKKTMTETSPYTIVGHQMMTRFSEAFWETHAGKRLRAGDS